MKLPRNPIDAQADLNLANHVVKWNKTFASLERAKAAGARKRANKKARAARNEKFFKS